MTQRSQVAVIVLSLLFTQAALAQRAPAPAAKPAPAAAPAAAPAPAATPAPAPAATPAPAAAPAAAPAPAAAATPAPASEPAAEPAPAATSVSVGASTSGAAEPPAADDGGAGHDRPLMLGVLVGAGFALDDTVGNVNAEGFGLGGQVGYDLGLLYLGGRFMYFFGGSSALPTGSLAMSTWVASAEVGIDVDLGDITLRPGALVGVVGRVVDQPPMFASGGTGGFIGGSGGSSPQLAFYLAPGAALIVPLSVLSQSLEVLYVGLDVRLPLALGDRSYVALDALGALGLRF
jgi:hypothetical protein